MATNFTGQRLERFETVPNTLFGKVQSVQAALFNDAVKLMGQLDTKGGHLVFSEANLRKVDEIINLLSQSLTEGEYARAISDFASEYPIQGNLIDGQYKQLLNKFNVKPKYKLTLQNSQDAAVDLLMRGIGLEVANPLRANINASISSSQSFKDLTDRIEMVIMGNQDRLGGLERYSKTYATDLFNTADRGYSAAIGDDLALDWCFYQGSLVKDSRDFCKERVGRYAHRMEWQAWGAGTRTRGNMATPRSGTWQGRHPSTDPTTIFMLTGGYNCLHIIDFTTIENVPESDVAFARSQGYID